MKVQARPDWIRGKVSWDAGFSRVRETLSQLNLNTVCLSAACPNRGECWEKGHATFMILGKRCTRGCRFCDVSGEDPEDVDPGEPARIAEAVKKLGIKYAVITSTTRDDLPDKGAGQFVETVQAVKKKDPAVPVEILIPDMGADRALLERIAASGASVIAHNIEIPEGLYPEVRPRSSYQNSIKALELLKKYSPGTPLKSSIIIGLGESRENIIKTIQDIERTGVDILYVGQYLSPSKKHWPVAKYYTPEEFEDLAEEALSAGFRHVCSGPMVRSSYKAQEAYSRVR